MPAIISTTPTAIIKAEAEKGTKLARDGSRYCSQWVSRLVNLSAPATIGTITKVYFSRLNIRFNDCCALIDSMILLLFYCFCLIRGNKERKGYKKTKKIENIGMSNPLL